jgi:hypothetical protein
VSDRGVRISEIAAEGGLAVRADGDEAEALERAAGGDGGEELADREWPLVLERLRRHRQQCVVGEQRQHARHVAGLEGSSEAADEFALGARIG